jgi:hypothetical protein
MTTKTIPAYLEDERWQFQLGLFRSAMVAMIQQLDARGFCFYPQLSVVVFLAARKTATKARKAA